MKPEKVVNKILLSYLGLGAIFGIGVVVENNNIQKALLGTGAIASLACVAGTMISKEDNDSSSDSNGTISDDQLLELRNQEEQLRKSFDEKNAQMQAVETDINSLQNEHNQLLSVISNLNDQKQQLESESQAWDEQIQSKQQELEAVSNQLEINQKQEEALGINITALENEKNILSNEVEQLSSTRERLEEAVSPIEEHTINANFDTSYYPTETAQLEPNLEEAEDVDKESLESVDSNVNPFVSDIAEEPETNQEDSDFEIPSLSDETVEELEPITPDSESPFATEHGSLQESTNNILEEPVADESEGLMDGFSLEEPDAE